jgi:hypothetical protein
METTKNTPTWAIVKIRGDYVITDSSGQMVMTDTAYYPIAPDYETAVKLVRLWNLACGVVNGD